MADKATLARISAACRVVVLCLDIKFIQINGRFFQAAWAAYFQAHCHRRCHAPITASLYTERPKLPL